MVKAQHIIILNITATTAGQALMPEHPIYELFLCGYHQPAEQLMNTPWLRQFLTPSSGGEVLPVCVCWVNRFH